MIKCAKYIGLTLISIVFLAMPVLLALSIILKWGMWLPFLLGLLVVSEIILIIFVIEALADEDIL